MVKHTRRASLSSRLKLNEKKKVKNMDEIDPDDCDTEIDEEEGTSMSRFRCRCGWGLVCDDLCRGTGNCEDCDLAEEEKKE